jgi:hypothetical protein
MSILVTGDNVVAVIYTYPGPIIRNCWIPPIQNPSILEFPREYKHASLEFAARGKSYCAVPKPVVNRHGFANTCLRCGDTSTADEIH